MTPWPVSLVKQFDHRDGTTWGFWTSCRLLTPQQLPSTPRATPRDDAGYELRSANKMRDIGALFANSKGFEPPEIDHGQTPRHRRTLEAAGAIAPATQAAPTPLPRPQADRRPQGVDRHPLRPEGRHQLGGSPPGDGLRLRHDLLEKAPGLEPGRGLAEAPREALSRVARGGSDRLGSGVDRQQLRAGSRRWRTDRPQPRRPPQEGEQAPDHHRCRRDTARGGDDGRPCPRRQSDDRARGRDPTGARQAGPPPTPAGPPVWRSGLRLGPASPAVAPARHPSADRAAADAARERVGEISLVRGADPVVAAQLREAAGPQG